MNNDKYETTINDSFSLSSNFVPEKVLNKQNISKRYYTACAVAQGILANDKVFEAFSGEDEIVKFIYSITDKLLEEEY